MSLVISTRFGIILQMNVVLHNKWANTFCITLTPSYGLFIFLKYFQQFTLPVLSQLDAINTGKSH